jgi:uncharacterized protein (TIGR03437 family)
VPQSLRCNLQWAAALLLCRALCSGAIGQPLTVQQTRYEVRVGEPVQIAAPPETLDFLLKAKTLRLAVDGDIDGAESSALVVGPNRARDRVLLATSLRISPGEYRAKLSATSEAGEERVTTLSIVVKPRTTVPSSATRPPVVLLNGWETGVTGACNASAASDTFGNLAEYLVSDGVPVVYFFDNCVVDPNQTIEVLGNDLATYLNSIKYDNGDQVPQIDLVAFSMGGLIARAYLSGLQSTGTATPPVTPLVRDLILIATPNFGSFVAGNYAITLSALSGTQDAELIPGSSFLWNLATWNQRGDDLRGVNALAIVGNAGPYLASLSATSQLNNASDGLVSETSAALGFALLNSTPTQVVPYCHVDPSVFTNTYFGTFNCTSAAGIANVTSETQETGEIVRSFLAGNSDWQSIGVTAAKDPWLSIDGGMFFAMENQSGSYVTDLTAVAWGSVALTPGGDTDVVYYTDFVNGTGDYQATSTSLTTINCGTLAEALGYFSAPRCKLDTAIYDVTPHGVPGWTVTSGSTITLTGNDFGSQCTSCQVLAIPVSSSTQTALQVSSWTNTAISAALPASLTGLLTIQVTATPGTDAITIMASPLAVSPSNLQFAYTLGSGVPAAQSVQIANNGSTTVTWSATASASWLSLSPSSGTLPSSLSVSVSPASLTAGTYTATVLITPSGTSNSPLMVNVTLTVAAVSGAALAVTPQALTFNYAPGGTTPVAQTISIANTGSGTLSWIASSSVPWASLSAASGSAPATATALATLSVSVNPASLAAGSYTGNVQIAAAGAAGSPVSVSLTLVVGVAQPAGVITGVVNGASFGAGFASATWVSIFGTNLSASTQIWGASDFVNGALPASLDQVSVTIDGKPAYVEYISPKQINVLAPDDATTGNVQVQVTAAGQASNSFTAQKQQYAPAFFTFDNGKYVAAEHSDYTLLGAAAPAKPGELVLLYGTGFGPTSPVTPTGQTVNAAASLPANSVQIAIGGVAAAVQFAGLTGSGLYQFNVTVPSSLPSGDAPVLATIGGMSTQSGVSITIQ